MWGCSLRNYSKHAYQKTLLLPKTKFPSRSNLQNVFDRLIPQSSQALYQEQFDSFLEKFEALTTAERERFVQERLFVLHDGPPYANGDLHLGHALNKILKDIICRYNLTQGKYVYFKPGWDCHGLPIELKALKSLDVENCRMLPTKVRSLAAKHAQRTIKSQRQTFEKFAIMTDWNTPYTTMQRQFELDQLKIFQNMFEKGLIKRQFKPVFWGTVTKTALAEGELEYNENHKSTSAYVKFPLTQKSTSALVLQHSLKPNIPIKYLIWTSTPWTLFSNRAICLNRKFEYSIVEKNKEYLIVESTLKDSILNDAPLGQTVSTLFGKDLENTFYLNPLVGDETPRPVLHGDHVTNSAGTGLVHTAPGHGTDDYLIGVANGLEIFSPVDHEGRYKLDDLPFSLHETLTDPATQKPRHVQANETTTHILKLLSETEMLFRASEYTHSYPYDWRSKKPIIIRSTLQWFADLTNVKSLALESLKAVKFFPERGRNRLQSFIQSRNEWCISRQRSWGVPIPAFYKKDNPEEVLMTAETVDHIIKVIEKKGIDSWFADNTDNMAEWMPEKYQNECHLYRRGQDTVDVWFDSGSSWKVLENFYLKELGLEKPRDPLANVYLEGSDQHRGWFQSSLLTKVASTGEVSAPYGTIVTHGFTLDENGIKMSKSIGNIIAPDSIIGGNTGLALPALGVDGLRFLVAQSDFTTDIVAGPTVMKHVAEAMKKFRLTLRFILGNLQVTNGASKILNYDQLRKVDQYTLCKIQQLLNETKQNYENLNFSKVLSATLYHMNNHLSAFYFDITKDALYSDAAHSHKRLQIQTTLYHILDAYRSIMGPITPIMVQEAWNYLPKNWYEQDESSKGNGMSTSPLGKPWKQLNIRDSEQLLQDFEHNHLAVLEAFNIAFHQLKGVTKSTQTTATLFYTGAYLPFTEEEMCDILQVSDFKVETQTCNDGTSLTLQNGEKATLVVKRSEMHECPRCWKHNSMKVDELCVRCSDVITC